jgi:hypothetical protein
MMKVKGRMQVQAQPGKNPPISEDGKRQLYAHFSSACKCRAQPSSETPKCTNLCTPTRECKCKVANAVMYAPVCAPKGKERNIKGRCSIRREDGILSADEAAASPGSEEKVKLSGNENATQQNE